MAQPKQPTIEQMQQALQARKPVPHLARGGNKFGIDSMTPSARGRASFSDQPMGNQIMKETGGNWLTGNVERELKPLRVKPLPDLTGSGPVPLQPHEEALNNWVDRNLTNYVKKQMATKEDPVRGLFEQGITHIPHRDVGLNRYSAPQRRAEQNQPQLAQTEEGKAWENATDAIVGVRPISGLHKSFHEPWMEKVSPDTKVANLTSADNLGFDHIMDVLREDLAEGRIRPEQLNKISMEQAVRRVHEYNEEKKKKMAETAIKQTEGMPLVKQYDNGHKWIELALPKGEAALSDLDKRILAKHQAEGTEPSPGVLEKAIQQGGEQKLAEALKYEGDTMGHCVGGYTPDVLEGRSRIFSLRDAKGEPHVTIETSPAEMRGGQSADEWLASPHRIVQIKGKGNAKPAAKYIPMVQDFVKSGKWSDVGDLHNTDLVPLHPESDLAKKIAASGVEPPQHVTQDELTQLTRQHKIGHKQGGTIRMAKGGSTGDIDEMRLALMNKAKLLEGSHTQMRLYHGTPASEGGKGKEAIRKLKQSKEGALGSGAYLTPNPDFAGEYAKQPGGNVLPVHARITNPLILTGETHRDPMVEALVKLGMTPDKASAMVEKAYEDKGYIGKQVQQRAQAAGHDALMQYRDGKLSEVVHYNPRMIKSAIGNRGTYDTSVDDLSMADGGGVLPRHEADANLAKFLEPSKEKRRMYHGTRQAGTRSVSKPGHEGIHEFVHGIRGMTFLSPDTEFANSYAGKPDEEGHHRSAVYPVHAQVTNPFDYENPEHVENVLPHLPYGTDYKWSVVHGKNKDQMRDALKSGMWELLEDKDIVDAIKHVGHDAMYMKENKVKNLGIFDPRKIKSATGNRGTYDTTKADITKAKGGTVKDYITITERPL